MRSPDDKEFENTQKTKKILGETNVKVVDLPDNPFKELVEEELRKAEEHREIEELHENLQELNSQIQKFDKEFTADPGLYVDEDDEEAGYTPTINNNLDTHSNELHIPFGCSSCPVHSTCTKEHYKSCTDSENLWGYNPINQYVRRYAVNKNNTRYIAPPSFKITVQKKGSLQAASDLRNLCEKIKKKYKKD